MAANKVLSVSKTSQPVGLRAVSSHIRVTDTSPIHLDGSRPHESHRCESVSRSRAERLEHYAMIVKGKHIPKLPQVITTMLKSLEFSLMTLANIDECRKYNFFNGHLGFSVSGALENYKRCNDRFAF